MRSPIVVLFLATIVSSAIAAPLNVTKGFAGAQWGQSPAEVEKETGAKPTPSYSDETPIPKMTLAKKSDDGTVETYYVFWNKKLVSVTRSAQLKNTPPDFYNTVCNNVVGGGVDGVVIDESSTVPPQKDHPGVNPPNPPNPHQGYWTTFSITAKTLTEAAIAEIQQSQLEKFKTEDLPRLLQ